MNFRDHRIENITVSDDTVYDPPLEGVNVSAAGTVVVVREDDTSASPYVAAGVPFFTGRIKKVKSTGTTATVVTGFRVGR